MKKFLAFLGILILVAAVAGYFLYPTIADQAGQAADAAVMRAYRAKVAVLTQEQTEALFAEAAAYNETIETVRASDVFSAGTPRTSRDYLNRLNIHEGVIGELVIPGIGVSMPVYHNSMETPADEHLVHLETSDLPVAEGSSSVILAGPGILTPEGILGDIGLTGRRMLEDLDRLAPGDLLILNVADRTMVYRVREVQMLAPDGLEQADLAPAEGQQTLNIVTRRRDRRMLVQSDRITIAEARSVLDKEDSATDAEGWKNVLLLGSPVLLLGFLVMLLVELIKKRRYLLPGEGRNAGKREKKNREKLDNLPTEPIRKSEHEKDDHENRKPPADPGPDAGADQRPDDRNGG